MVLEPSDSTTGAATMTCSKKHYWDLVSQMHDLRDAWHMLHSNIGFTFHSQALTKAWARLDRFYLLGDDLCPPLVSVQADYKWHLSDHFQ